MADNGLLAVFAQPDAESYRPGGTLTLLARSGVRRRPHSAGRLVLARRLE
ncbi:MAG TPA: hypothetical protein VI547_12215 [Anaerolineales bacterium]|nr:hypothetical protein [Anaerolineales bacterium]